MRYRDIIYLVIILALVLYIASSLNDRTLVAVPTKINSKVISHPQPVAKPDTILNKELLSEYKAAPDSLAKLQVFKKSVTQREYVETLEDSVQTITIKSTVTGTLDEQIISYRTNPFTMEKESPRSNTSIYLGAFTRFSTISPLQETHIGINLHLAHKKKLFTIGYDTSKSITAGIAFKLF